MKVVASKYNIIQFGLTFFIRDGFNVTAHPYNFYIFPRGYKTVNPIISLQSSTI
jgi:hypothetical protein